MLLYLLFLCSICSFQCYLRNNPTFTQNTNNIKFRNKITFTQCQSRDIESSLNAKLILGIGFGLGLLGFHPVNADNNNSNINKKQSTLTSKDSASQAYIKLSKLPRLESAINEAAKSKSKDLLSIDEQGRARNSLLLLVNDDQRSLQKLQTEQKRLEAIIKQSNIPSSHITTITPTSAPDLSKLKRVKAEVDATVRKAVQILNADQDRLRRLNIKLDS